MRAFIDLAAGCGGQDLRGLILGAALTGLLAIASSALASAVTGGDDAARWKAEAARVTITRDDWGIAHVHGTTDADAVFGMIYAQAEDDFHRIEANYLTSLGRAAEAGGEGKLYQDLRQRLFIDPESLKAQYAASPVWLKRLMDAWADGLNYYLATHPKVSPQVITRFEPWMALSFSEGSIGGDMRAWGCRAPPPAPRLRRWHHANGPFCAGAHGTARRRVRCCWRAWWHSPPGLRAPATASARW